MAYTIFKSDGTPVSIPDNAINGAFYNATGGGPISTPSPIGIQFVGRNAIGYGGPTAQNFLQMTENFANVTGRQPDDTIALQGQLWFDSTLKLLYVRLNNNVVGGMANWGKVLTVSETETGSTPVVNPSGTPVPGDLKVVGSITYLYADGAWEQVPTVNPTGTGNDGDIKVVGSVISMYANGVWQQVFPALYS